MPTAITWRASLDDTDFKAGLNSLATAGGAAMKALGSSSDAAGRAVGQIAAPAQQSTAAMNRLQRQADNFRASLDATFAAQLRFDREMDRANSLLAKGALTTQQHAAATTTMRANLEQTLAVLRQGAEGHNAHGAAVGFNRNQMLELSHVGRSVFDSLASGANPLRVLAQESGRITQVLSSGQGGVGGSLSALGRLFNPAVAGAVALTGALAALGAAGLKYSGEQRDLSGALLTGGGGATGATLGDLNAIAEAAQKAGDGTHAFIVQAEEAFVRAGVAKDNIKPATDALEAFAAVTGDKAPDALKRLATGLQDPVQGMKDWKEAGVDLTDSQIEAVKQTELLSGKAAAQALALQDLKGATAGFIDATTPWWTRFFKQVHEGFDGILTDLGAYLSKLGGVKTASLQDQRAALEQQLSGQQVVTTTNARTGAQTRTVVANAPQVIRNARTGAVVDQSADIRAQIAAIDAQLAKAQSRADKAVGADNAAGVRAANPDPTRIQELQKQSVGWRNLLAEVARTGNVAKLGGLSVKDYNDAIKHNADEVTRLETKGQKRPHAARRAPKGPADQTGELDNLATQAADGAERDYLTATRALIVGINARADAEKAAVDADLQKRLDTLAHDRARIDASLNDAHAREQRAALASAEAKERDAAAARKVAINREAEAQMLEQAMKTGEASAQYAVSLDGARLALATTLNDRRALELKRLDDQKAVEDLGRANALELQVAPLRDHPSADGSSAQEIARLTAEYLTAQQRADTLYDYQRQGAVVQYLNPLAKDAYDAAHSSRNDLITGDVSTGLKGLAGELVSAAKGAQSFGQALNNVAQQILSKIAEDLLNKYVVGPAAGGVSSLLSHIPGFATGTDDAPSGWRLVGERGPELERSGGGERIVTTSHTEQMLDALSTGRAPAPVIVQGAGVGRGGGGNITIHDNRTQGEPAPKVERKSNGDTTISLERMFDKAIRGNPGAVRDAAMGAPPKVTRRGA